MKIEIAPLADRDGFLADWRALHAQSDAIGVFLSPAWMAAWLAAAPADAEIFSISGADAGETVLLGATGLAPRALFRPRAVHLHELGRPDHDRIYVEYNDFLMSPRAPADARAAALAALVENMPKAGEIVLRNVPAPLAAAAAHVADLGGLGLRRLNEQPVFAVDLDALRAAGGDYLSSRSASFAAQVRRSTRLYEERGPVRLEAARTDAARAEAWTVLTDLHARAWRARGEPGAFGPAPMRAFHERLIADAPEMTELLVLRAGDEILGCLYNLVLAGGACNYQSGFRFEDDNRLKPGLLAHALAAQLYLERGYSVYDLLGGEAHYKKRLADEGETLSTLVLEWRGLAASVRGAARKARAVLR